MNKNIFLFLGDDIFNKLEAVKLDLLTLDSKSIARRFFSTLNISSRPKIENIFQGWSFNLYKTNGDIFYSGFNKSSYYQQHEHKILNEIEVLYAACGISDSFIVSKSRKLFFISNSDRVPKFIDLVKENTYFKKVDTEDLYTVALTEDGRATDIKIAEVNSIKDLNIPLPITDVACGKEHVLLLASTGVVFSYGIGSRGQLGHGNLTKLEQPIIIEALEGLQIESIAAGGWHSAAISSIGDLYMWGWNESGQLGLPCNQIETNLSSQAHTICCLPAIIELSDEKVRTVSCGSRHTAVVTENNQVWTWGWNNYGQLGNKNCLLSDKPEQVILPSNFIAQDVK